MASRWASKPWRNQPRKREEEGRENADAFVWICTSFFIIFDIIEMRMKWHIVHLVVFEIVCCCIFQVNVTRSLLSSAFCNQKIGARREKCKLIGLVFYTKMQAIEAHNLCIGIGAWAKVGINECDKLNESKAKEVTFYQSKTEQWTKLAWTQTHNVFTIFDSFISNEFHN